MVDKSCKSECRQRCQPIGRFRGLAGALTHYGKLMGGLGHRTDLQYISRQWGKVEAIG